MMEMIDFLTKTPAGLAVTIGSLLVLFFLFALIYERKTRKLYPDQNRRGTKAVNKAKAKKKVQKAAETNKKAETAADADDAADVDADDAADNAETPDPADSADPADPANAD